MPALRPPRGIRDLCGKAARVAKTYTRYTENILKEYLYMENKKPETVGKEVKFERIRRITGYLVGTTDRFNNAKQAEEKDRVKHKISSSN
jgi:anaerobic ribonucleoside-triphosphate reductase